MIIGSIILISVIFWAAFGHFCLYSTFRIRESDKFEKDTLCGGGIDDEDCKARVLLAREWLDAMVKENVYITSFDGLKLHGELLLHEDKSKGLLIFAHGYHSSCRRDLAIQIKEAYEDGYDALLIAQRGHRKSEGKYLSLGVNERYDILFWTRFANERFGENTPIGLVGLSMGGASVLMASELGLPENVKCIVSDCAFSSSFKITAIGLKNKKVPSYPTVFFMVFWAKILGGFNLNKGKPAKALEVNTRPVLLIHGERDTYVPTEMSYINTQSGGELVELFIVPKAKHAQSVYFDTDGYIKKMLSFLNAHMS